MEGQTPAGSQWLDQRSSGLPDLGYPVRLDVAHQPEYNRFLPLVKWLLLLPHYVVLVVLWLAGLFTIVASWFAVLITGRYPSGLFGFHVGLLRWSNRVTAYLLLMTDRYPAFSLAAQPDDAVPTEVERPEELERWRPLVAWLLVLPYYFVASLLVQVAYLLSFFAFFTILFAKTFPRGMFDINVVALRWQLRSTVYFLFMARRYPPFAWG